MGATAVDTSGSGTAALGRHVVRFSLQYGIYIVFLLICAAISVLSPSFLTVKNLSNVLLQSTAIGIIAVGMTFVIIVRGIDVSVGAIVALASAAGVGAIKINGQPWYVGLAIMLGSATFIGWVNGFSSARLRMPAFLVTLATSTIVRGLVIATSGGHIWYDLPPFFQTIGLGQIGPIPNTVAIMFVTFIAGHFLLANTAFGRRVFAVGTNPETARVSGINVEHTILYAFVLCGLLCGLSSLVLTARLNTFTPSMGTGFEFSAIAAVVIGGASLFGGEGNMGGTLVGVLIMSVVNNALNLLGLSAYYQDVVRGAIIFAAVLLDTLRQRYVQAGE